MAVKIVNIVNYVLYLAPG